MIRARRDYSAPVVPVDPRSAVSAETPVAGFFRTRLRSGGVYVGVKVFYGPPLDPVTGEELDRSHRWQALVNDRPIDFDRVWPKCAGDPVTAQEYAYLTSLQGWAEENAPDSAIADPHRKIDLLDLHTPVPF